MKNKVRKIGVLVSLILLLGWIEVPAEDTLAKVSQEVLAEKERVLNEMKVNVEKFILQAAEDRKVTKDEMVALRKLVKQFTKAKEEADNYLKFYGLKTSTDLNEELKKALKSYFNHHGLLKRDSEGLVKNFSLRLVNMTS